MRADGRAALILCNKICKTYQGKVYRGDFLGKSPPLHPFKNDLSFGAFGTCIGVESQENLFGKGSPTASLKLFSAEEET
jgi:hypothetical protein